MTGSEVLHVDKVPCCRHASLHGLQVGSARHAKLQRSSHLAAAHGSTLISTINARAATTFIIIVDAFTTNL